MNIIKIKEIHNLGIYSKFKWDSNCPEFKQFNFFYGWNYSGKTSLSRLFRCLEEKQCHPDYSNLSFKLETDNGEISNKNIVNDYPIRVFNEEFVEKNFKWNAEDHRVNPVLILGEDSIELQKELSKKENEKQQLNDEIKTLKENANNKEKELGNKLTNKASDIRNILAITNSKEFDKNTLENKLKEVADNATKYELSNEAEQEYLNLYRSQTKYEEIPELKIILKINEYSGTVKKLCEKEIKAQEIIEKLKNNPELNQWVRKGIELHKNESFYQFCGNKLPDYLIERLNKHFSDEYDRLIKELKDCEKDIQEHIKSISQVQFTDKARLYTDFSENYEQKVNELKNKIEDYKKILNDLISKLNEKQNKPFDELIIDITLSQIENDLKNCLNNINQIIKEHNNKISQLENEKKEAKKKLINHYSAKAKDEIKYSETKKEIDELKKQIEEKNNQTSNIEKNISEIKSKIVAANIGADKINTYLRQFFADDQIQLEPLDDGYYQVNRAGSIAKNLSAGEKNIISLVYFISKLEENSFDKTNSVIFIDDPVSSLDSNHTFQVYGFLSEKLKDCGQVFITTHNFDFFNLLKDMVKGDPEGTQNRKNKNDKENFYLIKKVQEESSKVAKISELPKVLRNFKSEYNYLFSILKEFNESSDKTNYELLYVLPNITRRFLEAYLFAKYPDGTKFKDKAEKFFRDFSDESEKRTVLKILDEYSHEENPEHTQKFPDINEIEIAVKTILDILQKKDNEHFDALSKSINRK